MIGLRQAPQQYTSEQVTGPVAPNSYRHYRTAGSIPPMRDPSSASSDCRLLYTSGRPDRSDPTRKRSSQMSHGL
ncbi:hypothetical protein Taro_009517, partial [Colocasia esculenta]|nr:hypothetical protein [Colocasia esculenta]